jgi:hypothetical protein
MYAPLCIPNPYRHPTTFTFSPLLLPLEGQCLQTQVWRGSVAVTGPLLLTHTLAPQKQQSQQANDTLSSVCTQTQLTSTGSISFSSGSGNSTSISNGSNRRQRGPYQCLCADAMLPEELEAFLAAGKCEKYVFYYSRLFSCQTR